MDDIQSKHCAVCHEPFIPDKRVGARQLVCFKLNCQQERKRRSQRRWVSKSLITTKNGRFQVLQLPEKPSSTVRNSPVTARKSGPESLAEIFAEMAQQKNGA